MTSFRTHLKFQPWLKNPIRTFGGVKALERNTLSGPVLAQLFRPPYWGLAACCLPRRNPAGSCAKPLFFLNTWTKMMMMIPAQKKYIIFVQRCALLCNMVIFQERSPSFILSTICNFLGRFSAAASTDRSVPRVLLGAPLVMPTPSGVVSLPWREKGGVYSRSEEESHV